MNQKYIILYVLDNVPNIVTEGDGTYPHVFKTLLEASNWLLDREKSIRFLSACESVFVINCHTGKSEAF